MIVAQHGYDKGDDGRRGEEVEGGNWNVLREVQESMLCLERQPDESASQYQKENFNGQNDNKILNFSPDRHFKQERNTLFEIVAQISERTSSFPNFEAFD